MKYFTKLSTDEYSDIAKWVKQNPLRMAILFSISCRVRSSNSSILGLQKGEFLLSEMEYADFGLKKSQRGQIRRIINELICFGYVTKTGRQTENAHSTIYAWVDNDFMDCSRVQIESDIENEQRANRERIESERRQTKNVRVLESKNVRDIISGETPAEVIEDSTFSNYKALVDYINQKLGKHYRYKDKKAIRQFKARLSEGYTGKDFQLAIQNVQKIKRHIESNFEYITPEFVTRSDKLEMLLNTSETQRKGKIAII